MESQEMSQHPEMKEQKVERLKREINGWKEIVLSNQRYLGELHSEKNREEIGRELNRLGCEADPSTVEYYRWILRKTESWKMLSEELDLMSEALERGEDTIDRVGRLVDLESYFGEKLNRLY